MLRRLLLAITLVLVTPIAISANSVDAKYEGIEITVNINQATAAELADLLKGIGLKKAQAIVDYREEHGPFQDADSLANVKGIGESTVEKNRPRIEL
ncbi:ComEA family DNA-binding protein [Vibrio atypicus]|jgi:competence protein ComEA|uniref:ComEA family DNA-binding protein n=1 Tax=Vibrio atypicus TaxID=558271 RepID=UPI0037359321